MELADVEEAAVNVKSCRQDVSSVQILFNTCTTISASDPAQKVHMTFLEFVKIVVKVVRHAQLRAVYSVCPAIVFMKPDAFLSVTLWVKDLPP